MIRLPRGKRGLAVLTGVWLRRKGRSPTCLALRPSRSPSPLSDSMLGIAKPPRVLKKASSSGRTGLSAFAQSRGGRGPARFASERSACCGQRLWLLTPGWALFPPARSCRTRSPRPPPAATVWLVSTVLYLVGCSVGVPARVGNRSGDFPTLILRLHLPTSPFACHQPDSPARTYTWCEVGALIAAGTRRMELKCWW